ncbi:hypothetical protein V9K67_03480 [Paraflavisolibacter sp. H34]|uniref:hypothetical protein n=1 Tax=Huijunlia imazamoxiresistens TaxID=3127457 RepID=UPI003016511B
MLHAPTDDTRIWDKIWVSEKVKWEQCRLQYEKDKNTAFVAWFEETYEKLTIAFSFYGLPVENVFLTRQAPHHPMQNRPLVFAEHYPLRARELEFLQQFDLREALFFSSLDEPLLKHFGSDKIAGTIKQLGTTEEECLEGETVSHYLQHIQDKIAAQVTVELKAVSAADWLMKNLTA